MDGSFQSTSPMTYKQPVQNSTPISGTKPSLENIMKSQSVSYSMLKGPQSLFPLIPGTAALSQEGQSSVDKKPDEDIIVLSDSSDSQLKLPSSQNNTPGSQTSTNVIEVNSSPAIVSHSKLEPNSNTPTVKIKMGLLQAAKMLKPSVTENKGQELNTSADNETSVDESSAMSEEESEAPIPSATEAAEGGTDSSSSEESSSSSSSSESGNANTSGSDDDGDADKDSESSDDDEDDESDSSDDNYDEKEDVKEQKDTPKLKMKERPVEDEDEEESSENADEIDLVSSGDEKDDEKDKDYNASEEDVIMISDEEYKPKGRAVIPSPPRKEDSGVEILVKDVPNFDPIFSSFM